MFGTTNSQWHECCQHQEQIAILQEKLMEIHNKLIDQLDICKEQEIKIIELTQQVQSKSSSQNFDTFNYQSFGHHSPPLQENQMNCFNSANDSSQSHVMKTQLLQADLEAMRNKVLSEITEKNRVKEELKELKSSHKKLMNAQIKKYEGLEHLNRKLQEEYEKLGAKYEKIKRVNRPDMEIDKISGLLAQAETKYANEKQNNRQLQSRCKMLEEKISRLEISKVVSRQSKASFDSANALHQQKEIQLLKQQIEKINTQVERSVVREDRHHKKRGFQQTKDLIKKLEETEHYIRRRKPNV